MSEEMATPSGETAIVEVIGRYVLCGEIGHGGMATVHFGRLLGPVGFSRLVAIKRLHPHLLADRHVASMFVDEARIAARIQHPNVVSTLDVVECGRELLIVMDYVHGASLSQLVRAARDKDVAIPQKIALAVMSNMLHGLHAAHEATGESGEVLGIVHRDISPQNVIVGIDGVARLLDFGVAWASRRIEDTQKGNIKGKLTYMAPEQIEGKTADRRSDIYSASVMLWELLAGEKLFSFADTTKLVIEKLYKDIDRPSLMRHSLPDAVDAVTLHGLARNPNNRFATAREMALAVEAYGPLATASEVGAWVESLMGAALATKRRTISAFERAVTAMREEDAAHEKIATPAAPLFNAGTRSTSSMRMRAVQLATQPTPSVVVAVEVDTKPSPPPPAPDRATLLRLEVARFYTPRSKRVRAVLIACGATLAIGAIAITMSSGARERRGATERTTDTNRAEISLSAPSVAPASPRSGCPSGMVAVPGGKFFLGTNDADAAANERPAHPVAIEPFCIDALEVRLADYKECSDRGECARAGTTTTGVAIDTKAKGETFDRMCNAREPLFHADHPVNCVTWTMADTYCGTRGARLPTEAEWELAARGPDGRRFPWGDSPLSPDLTNACDRACAAFAKKNRISLVDLGGGDDGFAATAPVGSFARGTSPFGARDMAGNVAEWTASDFALYTPGTNAALVRSLDSSADKVVRGGAWTGGAPNRVTTTARAKIAPTSTDAAIGFRCAR